jgi:hypothetical protein
MAEYCVLKACVLNATHTKFSPRLSQVVSLAITVPYYLGNYCQFSRIFIKAGILALGSSFCITSITLVTILDELPLQWRDRVGLAPTYLLCSKERFYTILNLSLKLYSFLLSKSIYFKKRNRLSSTTGFLHIDILEVIFHTYNKVP